jgi:peptide/nickel transport system substrate-binding protein
MRRGVIVCTIAVTALGLAVAACQRRDRPEDRPDGATPRRGGTVRIAVGADPQNLMPYGSASADASLINGFLFRMLADTDRDLVSFTPMLARSWEWSADSLDLTLHLRDDARWSDGRPVTADDVVFTHEVAQDSLVNWRSRHWKQEIAACTAVSPHTVRYRLKRVFPDAFRYAKEGFVLPRHVYADVDRSHWEEGARARQPVGCGPYVLARWEPGQRLVLEPNPHYYDRDRIRLDRLVFEIVPDPATRLAQLRAGAIDFLDDVPAREAAAWRDAGGDIRVLACPGRSYDYIAYNRHDPLFASRNVREALTRAIDREAIVRGLCYGFAEVFESPFVPIVWAYDRDRPPTPFDRDGARRLLAAEGWHDADGDGWLERDGKVFEFTLLVSDTELRRAVAVPVQADWKAIGVKAEIDIRAREAVKGLRDQQRYQATFGGWSAAVTPNLRNVWGCTARQDMNFVAFCDAVVDSLNAAALLLPQAQALPLFIAAQRRIAADYPYTWMYTQHTVAGVGPRLQGVRVDARGAYVSAEDWWVRDGR